MKVEIKPSENYIQSLPQYIQQAFKIISEKEHWTATEKERLYLVFEKLSALPNNIFPKKINSSIHDDGKFKDIIATLAYLRIEQCFLLFTQLDKVSQNTILQFAYSSDRASNIDIEAEILNLKSRIDILFKLGMADTIFTQERAVAISKIIMTIQTN